jgi:hypothetical protein
MRGSWWLVASLFGAARWQVTLVLLVGLLGLPGK